MKVLVTGGAGFIGSHTVVDLQTSGYEVVVLDNFVNSNRQVLNNIEKITGKRVDFVEGDVRNKTDLDTVFKRYPGIEAVIHFAAYKAVGESVQSPLAYYENNIAGTVYLLQAMKAASLKKIVFSSSCTVYGEVDATLLPITENAPVVKANSPYGNTKKIGEELLLDASKAEGFNVVSLRYFNPIGAHDTALIGELPLGIPNNLVPFITQTAIGKRKELTVFGNDYPTRDGSCIRDYIHVMDLANAHVKAIDYLHTSNENFSVFNIGTGQGNTVLEVVTAFENVTGTILNYKIGPRRAGDVVQIYASCQKAEQELGWKAERTLENALETAWKWEQYLATSPFMD
ncbi:MAG: UDP-glucose 4-epimerase GalE [Bacteroidia bacterium]|jgi:UDP-glucose 4-epimerase|nr:UDP-glucose 4-epimerase GalE [Bacteroidia bacterium]